MTNFIFRHGQTDHSLQHLVNGDPARAIQLNRAGEEACRRAGSSLPLRNARTWITSEFSRARQTALLLMGASAVETVVDPQLNELDYGIFEGAPFLSYGEWLDRHGADARPDGATESQREGIVRMLAALRAVTGHPGERVIVGHGLLISVLTWGLNSQRPETLPLFLPEAPYVEALALSDDDLADLVTSLFDRIAPAGVDK